MSTSIKSVFSPIQGNPNYIQYEYKFNWVSIFSIFVLSYTISSFYIFLKLSFFSIKDREKIRNGGLRIEIFQSFFAMQFWNIQLIIGEYMTFRIPYTGLVTSFYASENPQFMLKLFMLIYNWAFYSSQLLTVLFYVLRAAVLYSRNQKSMEKVRIYAYYRFRLRRTFREIQILII